MLRPLHELLWYLTEALTLHPPADLRDELARARAETAALTEGDPTRLRAVDVAAHRDRVNPLLSRASDTGPRPRRASTTGARTCSGRTCAGSTCAGPTCAGRC